MREGNGLWQGGFANRPYRYILTITGLAGVSHEVTDIGTTGRVDIDTVVTILRITEKGSGVDVVFLPIDGAVVVCIESPLTTLNIAA